MAVPTDRRCPICARPVTIADAPFCSSGCRNRDLLQWLDDGYRLPGPPIDPDGVDSGQTHD